MTMPIPVIKAENISKKYRLGVLNSGSLKQDIYAALKGNRIDTPVNELWALKDINFTINRGEAVGFIGRNGAGKSTLMKILSRITLPTTGSIKGIGKLASLLEVGTGFHPELTGRENVFLNGHILGMKKKEVLAKFDEIVAFAGIDRFIDTPVKRYSSGMYVRLAFAVAAHLDHDILIVDEALAVGDAVFQTKCLQKMHSVTRQENKTVLFVSHNMQAIRDLCSRLMCLYDGYIIDDSTPAKVIGNYLQREKMQYLSQQFDTAADAPGNEHIRIRQVSVSTAGKDFFDATTPLKISFAFWQYADYGDEFMVGIHIYDWSWVCIADMSSAGYAGSTGIVSGECTIPAGFLNHGIYYISFDFISNKQQKLYSFEACLSFEVRQSGDGYGGWTGYVRPSFPVNLNVAPL